jgi:hypothetical protein
MVRLWSAALSGALIPWVYKLAVDRGSPFLSAHENAVHSKWTALGLLAIYGAVYVGITAALGIPEARNVLDRSFRLLRIPVRVR